MDFFRHRSFRILGALFALLLVSDIVADAIHDASGACATESQSSGDHDSCPACACSIHTSSAAAPDVATARFVPGGSASESFSVTDDQLAPGEPPSIDHPPQLA